MEFTQNIKIIFTLLIVGGIGISVQGQNCIDSTKIDTINNTECYPNSSSESHFTEPVCGCDSITYPFPSCARSAGVKRYEEGGCECQDSSLIRADLFRDRKIPHELYIPVCGCDGRTYWNSFLAYFRYGITQWTMGPCSCIDSSVIDLSIRCDFLIGDNKLCGCDDYNYDSQCKAFYWNGVTGISGGWCECVDEDNIVKDTICPDERDYVCGCDTVTYINECVAKYQYGVEGTKPGKCICVDSSLLGSRGWCPRIGEPYYFVPVCGCDTITYQNACMAVNNFGIYKYDEGPCACPDTNVIDLSFGCRDEIDWVCGCDDKTYLNPCTAYYTNGVAPTAEGPCRCHSPEVIDPDANCDFEEYDPVCGCDSVTYRNACSAAFQHGITSWTSGPCDFLCVDTFFLDTSQFCRDIYDPVCGCDSVTYQNACIALHHHAIVNFQEGHCDSLVNSKDTKPLDLLIYPSITQGDFHVRLPATYIDHTVFDIHGQEVSHKVIGTRQGLLSLRIAQRGVYVILVKLESGQVVSGKVLVE